MFGVSVCLSVCLSVCPLCLSICVWIYLSVSVCVCVHVSMCAHLYVRLRACVRMVSDRIRARRRRLHVVLRSIFDWSTRTMTNRGGWLPNQLQARSCKAGRRCNRSGWGHKRGRSCTLSYMRPPKPCGCRCCTELCAATSRLRRQIDDLWGRRCRWKQKMAATAGKRCTSGRQHRVCVYACARVCVHVCGRGARRKCVSRCDCPELNHSSCL